MAPDHAVFDFVRDWLWAPLLALVAWAWTRNEREHDMLRSVHEKLRDNTSVGYSTMNDRIMEHVDERVSEVRDENRRKTDKINEHIGLLFQNAEKDRAVASERHIELLTAIHHGLSKKADK